MLASHLLSYYDMMMDGLTMFQVRAFILLVNGPHALSAQFLHATIFSTRKGRFGRFYRCVYAFGAGVRSPALRAVHELFLLVHYKKVCDAAHQQLQREKVDT